VTPAPPRAVAVVTGAGRGLGRGIATALAGARFDLVLSWHRDKDSVSDTLSSCESLGSKVRELQGDVVDPSTSDALVSVALSELGSLDVWVNNAGVSVFAPLTETTAAQMGRMVDVNLMGTFHGLRAAARSMVATGTRGKIINVASDLGVQAAMGLGGYSATKFAVVGLTQAAALELGPAGITVNAVCPGTVETDMVMAEEEAEAELKGVSLEEVHRRLVDGVPAGRLCTVEDVGQMVAWLAGPDASYVNGQALCVNGGSVLH